jgi:hypothetical protein
MKTSVQHPADTRTANDYKALIALHKGSIKEK